MAPRDFVDRVVLHGLAPRYIVEGADFFFGRGRSGNVVTLENLGTTRGFDVSIVDAVVVKLPEGQRRVSSTLIRGLVSGGNIDDANYCLGRSFTLHGTIITGQGRGRLLDFPTANIDAKGQVIPADGVYAAKALIAGKEFISAVSIGNKPTFGPSDRAIEAFLIGASGDFYGQEMILSFVRQLRKQRKFASGQELQQQIAKDVDDVRSVFG